MKQLLSYLILGMLMGCSKPNKSIHSFSGQYYRMTLWQENGIYSKFSLYNNKSRMQVTGRPELIKVDGEIPEGTNRIDYNNPNDFSGFKCDSTYYFLDRNIKVVFAVESVTQKRLDLMISNPNNSKGEGNEDLTLVNDRFR